MRWLRAWCLSYTDGIVNARTIEAHHSHQQIAFITDSWRMNERPQGLSATNDQHHHHHRRRMYSVLFRKPRCMSKTPGPFPGATSISMYVFVACSANAYTRQDYIDQLPHCGGRRALSPRAPSRTPPICFRYTFSEVPECGRRESERK